MSTLRAFLAACRRHSARTTVHNRCWGRAMHSYSSGASSSRLQPWNALGAVHQRWSGWSSSSRSPFTTTSQQTPDTQSAEGQPLRHELDPEVPRTDITSSLHSPTTLIEGVKMMGVFFPDPYFYFPKRTQFPVIKARGRPQVGKRFSYQLRKNGRIPISLQNQGEGNSSQLHMHISEKQWQKIQRIWKNSIRAQAFDLELEENGKTQVFRAVVSFVNEHPLTQRTQHVLFQLRNKHYKQKVHVPIVLLGTEDCMIRTNKLAFVRLRQPLVECYWHADHDYIPLAIPVNVRKAPVGATIFLSHLRHALPEGLVPCTWDVPAENTRVVEVVDKSGTVNEQEETVEATEEDEVVGVSNTSSPKG